MKTLIKILLVIGLLSFCSLSALASDKANNAIVEQVHRVFKLDTASYTIDIISDGLQLEITAESRITIKPLYQSDPIGRFAIVATHYKNDKEIESRQIRLFIHKFAEVVFSKDRLSRFDEIDENSVAIERKEITELREQPLKSIDELTSMRARRNISRGTIITSGDVETIPAIKSHSDVHIVYAGGLFKVTSKGEALQDGRIGDFIRVKNKSSNKIVIARVVDETSVAVER